MRGTADRDFTRVTGTIRFPADGNFEVKVTCGASCELSINSQAFVQDTEGAINVVISVDTSTRSSHFVPMVLRLRGLPFEFTIRYADVRFSRTTLPLPYLSCLVPKPDPASWYGLIYDVATVVTDTTDLLNGLDCTDGYMLGPWYFPSHNQTAFAGLFLAIEWNKLPKYWHRAPRGLALDVRGYAGLHAMDQILAATVIDVGSQGQPVFTMQWTQAAGRQILIAHAEEPDSSVYQVTTGGNFGIQIRAFAPHLDTKTLWFQFSVVSNETLSIVPGSTRETASFLPSFCPGHQYLTAMPNETFASGSHFCKDSSICDRGTYIEADATWSSDRVCTPCGPETFANVVNSHSCENATVCLGTLVLAQLTPSTDRACVPSFSLTTTAAPPTRPTTTISLTQEGSASSSLVAIAAGVAAGVLLLLLVVAVVLWRRRRNPKTRPSYQGETVAMTRNPVYSQRPAEGPGQSSAGLNDYLTPVAQNPDYRSSSDDYTAAGTQPQYEAMGEAAGKDYYYARSQPAMSDYSSLDSQHAVYTGGAARYKSLDPGHSTYGTLADHSETDAAAAPEITQAAAWGALGQVSVSDVGRRVKVIY